MTIKLIVNGVDFSAKLSTYNIDRELSQSKVVVTLGGEEREFGKTTRDVVRFSFVPLTEKESEQYFETLSASALRATYTKNGDKTADVRLASNLDKAFLLDSIDGKRRYRGGEIVLRNKRVN